MSSTLQEGYGEAEPSESVTLIDQYIALLLATFIQCGLLDVSARSPPVSFPHWTMIDEIGARGPCWRECQLAQSQSHTVTGRDTAEI